jgi:hypothetical protein
MKKAMILFLLAGLLVFVPLERTTAADRGMTLREQLLTLDATKVSIDFTEKPLHEVLAFFTSVTEVNLIVSPLLTTAKDDYDLNVTLKLKNVSVRQVLAILIELKGLSSVYRHGVIMITTPKDARGKPYLRIYSIGDLTMKIRDFPGPDMMLRPAGSEGMEGMFGMVEEGKEHAFADPEFIQDLVQDNCGEDTWEDDKVAISVTERYMVVRTYGPVHKEITRLLMLLRGYR